MATKNLPPQVVDETANHPSDSDRFYVADAASPHPGALCCTVIVGGVQKDLRFEDATAQLDGESKPTGVYTYAAAAPFTQQQVNNLKTYRAAWRKRALVLDGFTVA